MRRREFIASVGAAVAAGSVGARAQQSDTIRRVGFFTAGRARNNVIAPAYHAFVEQLRKLGYSDGRNVVVDLYESDQSAKELSDAAAEMVRKGSDVIVASGTEAALKASIAASSTTPIVMVAINY